MVYLTRSEARAANIPNPEKIKTQEMLVNEADVIFRLMTSPSDLEKFDILTEETKQLIENWRKIHRKLN